MPEFELEKGKRYCIRFKQWTENGRYREMEFVGSYLGTSSFYGEHLFNQRPAAGTGSVHPKDLIAAIPTGREPTQTYKP
jgi:hypothetical protein